MSAILNTKRACERALVALLPTIPIAFENVSFNPPTDKLYIRTQFAVRSLTDPVLSSKYYRENISFQVFVIGLPNVGTSAAISVAEQIRNRFDKGTCFTETGMRLMILNTPQISSSGIVENRLVIPVLIDVAAEVFKEY
jgi:glutamine phosphoribosylpyrophosphate amidotransferase